MSLQESLAEYIKGVNEIFTLIAERINLLQKQVDEMDEEINRILINLDDKTKNEIEVTKDIFTIAQMLADLKGCSVSEILPVSY